MKIYSSISSVDSSTETHTGPERAGGVESRGEIDGNDQAVCGSTFLQARDYLRGLGLSDNELVALQNQGFVAAEFRRRGHRRLGPYFRLHWRQNGRQRVRYLGRDADLADQIKVALQQLQRPRRLVREVSRLMREARRGLRVAKQIVVTGLPTQGSYFHGYSIRQQREDRSELPFGHPQQQEKDV